MWATVLYTIKSNFYNGLPITIIYLFRELPGNDNYDNPVLSEKEINDLLKYR